MRGGVKMAWKKMCKVCDGEIDPKNLSEHKSCLEYTSIIRHERTED